MASTAVLPSPSRRRLLGLGAATLRDLPPRDPDRAAAAHVLNRTAMTTRPDRVDELAGRRGDDLVAAILAPADVERDPAIPRTDDWWDIVRWWLERMTEPGTGLTDRMAWFWHGLLTTNAWKVSETTLIADQLALLRSGARGNFRTLLHGFVTSGALLDYLDASYSMASNPNENLGRELMELYTIGRGHYTEDDVRAAARALAGWVVDDGEVRFERSHAFVAPLIYLGEQERWDTAMVVDRLCDHPATAARIAARLWTALVGTELTEAAGTELGRWWQDRDLEIEPLLERILLDPAFQASPGIRVRSGIEWFCNAQAAAGRPLDELWYLEALGQMPYLPPSPAGWPEGRRWLAPGSLLTRAGIVHSVELGGDTDTNTDTDIGDDTDGILARCGLHRVSPATVQAVEQVTDTPYIDDETIRSARWRLALTSPEFQLA